MFSFSYIRVGRGLDGEGEKKATGSWLWPEAADTDCDARFDEKTQFEHRVIISQKPKKRG